MDMLRFCTRRYADPTCVLSFQAPGFSGEEARLSEDDAMAVKTQGLHDRLGDYWLYLYAWEGEAYLLVQYHNGNQGLMAPPIALKSFDRVTLERVSDVDRVLKFYLGDSAPWCFPYRLQSQHEQAELSQPFLYEGEEAQDFGLFISGLAQDRARMLDFIDFQDPENDVVERLVAVHVM